MDWGILLGVVGIFGIPLALATLGLTMAANTPGEFSFLRACFVAAGVISAVAVFLLQWNYPEGSPVMRAIAVALAGALVFGSISVALDWVKRKEAATPAPSVEKTERSTTSAPHEDLRVSFQSPNGDDILGEIFSFNFIFKNEGSTIVFLNGVGVYQLVSKYDAKAPPFNFGSLGDPYGFKMVAPSPGPQWTMMSDGNPIGLYDPIAVTIDGKEGKNAKFSITPHSAVAVSATFKIAKIDRDIYNRTILFPIIYSVDASSNPVSVICPGPNMVWDKVGSMSWIGGLSGNWISVLPRNPNDFACRIITKSSRDEKLLTIPLSAVGPAILNVPVKLEVVHPDQK